MERLKRWGEEPDQKPGGAGRGRVSPRSSPSKSGLDGFPGREAIRLWMEALAREAVKGSAAGGSVAEALRRRPGAAPPIKDLWEAEKNGRRMRRVHEGGDRGISSNVFELPTKRPVPMPEMKRKMPRDALQRWYDAGLKWPGRPA